jgi:CelD/BcsL family acetyltransferase involved in cellulose biosynthesis
MECRGTPQQIIDDRLLIRAETFATLMRCWQDRQGGLQWQCLFVLPPWLKTWWDVFKPDWEQCLLSVRQGDELIGIAPLMVKDRTARLMGSPDVCDCLDIVVAPGREAECCRALLGHLRYQGVSTLDLGPVRDDSAVYTYLIKAAQEASRGVLCALEDVMLQLSLPSTWEEFLSLLAAKDRHEIRRKFRRLEEAGGCSCRMVSGPDSARAAMDAFLDLFTRNRPDKASFMDDRMARFFRSLGDALAQAGILKLFFLDLGGRPAAAALCFDYNSTIYLYNNGYDRAFSSLSVGLLSKAESIRASISLQRKTYNFLKGAEDYKYRLGGAPISLHRCRITL